MTRATASAAFLSFSLGSASCVQLLVAQSSSPPQTIPLENLHPELRAQLELLLPYKEQVRNASNIQELIAAANAARDRAELRVLANEPYSAHLFSIAGDAFERAEQVESALSAYDRILTDGPTVGWKAYARYRRGNMLPVARRAERIPEYSAAVQLITSANADIAELDCLSLSAIEWASELSFAGQHQAAINARATLRDRPGVWTALSEERRGHVIIGDARDLCKLGQGEAAIETWDSLLIEAPTLGHADGRIVIFLMERAARCAQDAGDSTHPETQEDLKKIWEDPVYSDMPEVMHCGSALAWRCKGPDRGAQVAPWRVAIINRWREKNKAWSLSVSEERLQDARDVYTSEFLGYLAAIFADKDWARVVSEAGEFLEQYPECDQASGVQELRDEARTHL